MKLKIKDWSRFKDLTQSDLAEVMFIEKTDRIELFTYVDGVPAMFCFDLIKKDFSNWEQILSQLKLSSVELVSYE